MSSTIMAAAVSSITNLAHTLLQSKFGITRAQTPAADEITLNLEPSSHEDLEPFSSALSTARLLHSLGEGTYGCVYKVRLLHNNSNNSDNSYSTNRLKRENDAGSVAALKIFKGGNLSLQRQKRIVNEMEISLRLSKMASLKTPIVRSLHAHLVKASESSDLGKISTDVEEAVHCLSMELCEGGDLVDFMIDIQSQGKGKIGLMTEREAASFFYPVAKAVDFCHRNRVLHLDVKPANVLFRKKGRLETACLGDFSLATRIPSGKPTVAIASLSKDTFQNSPGVGTDKFMAPEVAEEGLYSPLADVFSLGCVLLYALTGSMFPSPYFASWRYLDSRYVDTLMSNVIYINQREAWAKLSPKAKHLITGMLCPDPLRRLNVQEVLSHPWLIQEQRGLEQPWTRCGFKPPMKTGRGFRIF